MKTINSRTSHNTTGLTSITFRPAERGQMLQRLESLRQKAMQQLVDVPRTKLSEANSRTLGLNTH
ncbi:MAG: hypothetical protein AAFZ15_10880 [Bacteroidota bacterium]